MEKPGEHRYASGLTGYSIEMRESDTSSLAKVLQTVLAAKFGPGAIGRVGTIAMAAMVVISIPVLALVFFNPIAACVGLFLIAAIAIYTLQWCFRYAEQHPVASAMDGAQMTRVLTQRGAIKPIEGIPPPPDFDEDLIQNPLIKDESQ